MKVTKKLVIAAFLLVICILIHFYSLNQLRVENGYSARFSPAFTQFLRSILGRIPFSIGDFIYGGLVIWITWSLVRFVGTLLRQGAVSSRKSYLLQSAYKLFVFCATIYILFNLFWGINYDRKGIAWQLSMSMEKYSEQDLKDVNNLLIQKINLSKRVLLKNETNYPSNRELYNEVNRSYKKLAGKYSFLQYNPASLKTSMWGWLGNYTGFTGYYNPFTGEAQVNTSVPSFLQPFIACHEVAHQLGYAKEMEANFVGYLAASTSTDTLFHYSVYLDLFTYANRTLYLLDSVNAKMYRKQLDSAVVSDIRIWAEFNRKHRSPVEPIIAWIYGNFLKGNRQPQGLLSYDEVTAFLISYYKKFGKI